MNIKRIFSVLLLSTIISGCSNVSSSSVPAVSDNKKTKGVIYITQESLPENIHYKVIGQVEANARYGYEHVVTLYPMLAAEAKSIGANAIINTHGGHRVALFSWAAPYTSGTAIKIDDIELLKKYEGDFY
ncbi:MULTISPECIES: hypothetical protein [unclassified Photobacterium]|uniref:hypothetical protein n=1 Tax=unclassified Photobacterium TaxID=2628852 RepID=UPI001EDCDA13|nr:MULTISPECIES: hypothetical protein [unclassified Photobacterium]MCG3864529.1 hypothetical protein [Photobacterium sp. Ph6]MCG3876063.1 hypothetical protein [Photobacterium sp. Ph5]